MTEEQTYEVGSILSIGSYPPYLKENTTYHHYKHQYVNTVQGIIPVHNENQTEPVYTKRRLAHC
jgi:hypothetical protein